MNSVGINGITGVLLVYTCQQGSYPRGHVLPLRLPVTIVVVVVVTTTRMAISTIKIFQNTDANGIKQEISPQNMQLMDYSDSKTAWKIVQQLQ
jgi:hypothetical protein